MKILDAFSQKERRYTTKKVVGQELSSELLIDPTYQRPLSQRRVQLIVDNFNEELVNLIKVSRRDGKLYVFDGQHTKAALEKRNGNRPVMVGVLIFEFVGLTSAEQKEKEAELFSYQNGNSQGVNSAPRFKALYESKNMEILHFHSVTNSAGVLMDFTQDKQDRKIVCFKEAYIAWLRLGNLLYVDMLRLVTQIWHGDKNSYQASIIAGMSIFLATAHNSYCRQTLIDSLTRVTPRQIMKWGAEIPENDKHKYAQIIADLYNAEMAEKQRVV